MWPNAKERLPTFSHYGNDQNHKNLKPSHDSYYRKGGEGGGGVGHSTVVKPAVLNSAPHIPICGFCASASKENGIRPPLD